MGLRLCQIRDGMTDSVIEHAKAAGIAIIRTFNDEFGTHYFFKRPKQNREASFTIYKDQNGNAILSIGASCIAESLPKILRDANLIVPYDLSKTEESPTRRWS